MPWCDDCSRFYNPNTLPESGQCPTCGRVLMRPAKLRRTKEGRGAGADVLAARADTAQEADLDAPEDEERVKLPWHFWLLVVALAIYLGWRLVQLVMWLVS